MDATGGGVDLAEGLAMTFDRARFRMLREGAGLTQQALATRASLAVATVTQLENGRMANPRLATLQGLAEGMGLTVGQLLGEVPAPQDAQAKKPARRKAPKGARHGE